jgi:hypothetical protein
VELLLDLLAELVRSLHEFKVGKRLKRLKAENPKWFWVVIGVGCWTVFVVGAPWLWFTIAEYLAGYAPGSYEWEEAAVYGVCVFCPPQVCLTGLPWLVLLLVLRAKRERPRRRARRSRAWNAAIRILEAKPSAKRAAPGYPKQPKLGRPTGRTLKHDTQIQR